MSRRKYSIHKAPGYRLTDKEREILGTAWNNYIRRCRRISLRRFAKIHGVPYETWRREYSRGAVYKTIRDGNRWIYAEYDLEKARESIREGKANMGTKMKVTIGMAILFRHFVLKLRRSPYDARQSIVEAFPDRKIPCLKTFYNHIEAGDMGIHHGDTPYHPHRKRKPRTPAHDARTVPGRRQIKDRPAEANDAKELARGYCDFCLFPERVYNGDVRDSYIIELKYSKPEATPAEIAAKAEEGVAQLRRYAADPFVPELAAGTRLHCLLYQFQGTSLIRAEEIAV